MTADADRVDQAKKYAELVYALQAASFFTGVTFIPAIIINYLKLEAVVDTWVESHFVWQMRTFWFGLVWGILGFITFFVVIGTVLLIFDGTWIIYRIVKGWLYLREGKPMYVRRKISDKINEGGLR